MSLRAAAVDNCMTGKWLCFWPATAYADATIAMFSNLETFFGTILSYLIAIICDKLAQ